MKKRFKTTIVREGSVMLELDETPRTVEPPPDLVLAMKATPPAFSNWKKLSHAHQREHIEAIEEAKKAPTRVRRIAKAVQMLTAQSESSTARKPSARTAPRRSRR